MIAVLIDETLAVAEQEALALQLLVKKVRIDRVAARQPRIVDLDALDVEIDAGGRGGLLTRSSRPTRKAVPRPWLTNESAARMTCSSSPSAKTTRFG